MHLIFLLLVMIASPAAAQAQNRISTTNRHGWFNYFGDHAVSKRWELHLEGQWRRHDLGLKWQQLLLRPAANYKINDNLVLTAGYAFVDTFRYGEFPTAYRFPEHRFFEQILLKHRSGNVDLQHRYRLEQRHFGERTDPDINKIGRWRYENRFRYLIRASIPITFDKKFYIAVSNEFFINFGKNVAANLFDQNRVYGGLGFPIAKATRFEAGYMFQTIQQRNGRILEYNNTLQIAVYSSLPFFKKANDGKDPR